MKHDNRATGRAYSALSVRPSEPAGLLARGLGWALWAFACLALAFFPVSASAETEPGTVLNNIAQATFSYGGVSNTTVSSNTHSLTVSATPTASTLSFMKYAPTDPSATLINASVSSYSTGTAAGPWTAMGQPTDPTSGLPINVAASVPLVNTTTLLPDEPFFIVVTDADQDLSFTTADTIVVTVTTLSGDTEYILLTETGPHTGVFTGYMQGSSLAGAALNGDANATLGSGLTVSYTDPTDGTDVTTTSVTVGTPTATLGLYVTKTAGKESAATGDFVPYRITVAETRGAPTGSVVVSDRLPHGFRYRKGSTRIGGADAPDPSISADGRILSFSLGTLGANDTATVTFVAEVAAGARIGKAVNYASASATGPIASNLAHATVMVREEFMRGHNILVGQVLINECGKDLDAPEGLPDGLKGVRIYLEDGTYVVTDDQGMFHFEGVTSGTHVVQMDIDTLPGLFEPVLCEDNTTFAGRAFSQFVDLKGGALWRVDFHVRSRPRSSGDLVVNLSSALKDGTLDYTLPVKVGSVPLSDVRLTVIMPEGSEYLEGSATFDGKALSTPDARYSSVTFRLGDMNSGMEDAVRFRAVIPSAGENGTISTRAVFTFDTAARKNQRTPLLENTLERTSEDQERVRKTYLLTTNFKEGSSELTDSDRKAIRELAEKLKGLPIDQLFGIGHTDVTALSRTNTLFRDNYELSRARAREVVRYLGELLKLTPDQLSYMGAGPDQPIETNATAAGRARNRRVEVKVYTDLKVQDYALKTMRDRSGEERVETRGARPGEEGLGADPDEAYRIPEFSAAMPQFDPDALAKEGPGLKVLWPAEGHQPFTSAVNIAVKHSPSNVPALYVNGEEISAELYEDRVITKDRSVAVSRWRGVSLLQGTNTIESVDKQTGERTSRTVHFAGAPVKAELAPEKSRLVANGKLRPVIAVRLTDKDGQPARPGMMGTFYAVHPHIADRVIEGRDTGEAQYTIGYDGIAYLMLTPTTTTGEAVVRVQTLSGEAEVRVWLEPELRDWILVGLVEGTAGYNMVSGNMESLEESGEEDDYYQDGRLAFFAKGKIKGEWLLTAAYDSAKPSYQEYKLYQQIDPDSFYTLYGDGTEQGYEASSSRRLYVKLEREQFYALFGDFDTGLTVTELGRYSRGMNGLKSEYKGRTFSYSAFVSKTSQAFVKDELRGDGTSGLYKLSRRNIVMNSERITLITRDRFRSEIMISEIPLGRHIDYSIDYEQGTLFFKEPVSNKDFDMNPIYIIIEYESYDPSDASYNYGGRGAVKLGKAEVGATAVHEQSVGAQGDLRAVDTSVSLTNTISVKAEAATSTVDNADSVTEGSAYTLAVSREGKDYSGTVYSRRIGGDFGLGHQSTTERGTSKTGFDANLTPEGPWSYSLQAYRQTQLASGDERDYTEATTKYSMANSAYHGGLRRVTDRMAGEPASSTMQMTTGARWYFLDRRLTLKADREQTVIERDNPNADYPTRTTVGADFRATQNLTLMAAHEQAEGSGGKSQATRAGLVSTPWSGGEVRGVTEQRTTENSMRLFSTTGLKQTWNLNERWTLSGGFDKTITHKQKSATHAAIDEDFMALFGGARFVREKLTWNTRVESHTSDTVDKIGVFTAVSGEPRRGLGLTAGLHMLTKESTVEEDTNNSNLRFGLAWRPSRSRWTVLDRLDLIYEERSGGTLSYDNWRVVNNHNTNYKVRGVGQLSAQYGLKYVKENIEGKDYSGFTDLLGIEARYFIDNRFDVGPIFSRLHSWHLGQSDNRAGLSLGYTPVRNMWLSIGYNFHGFYDRDFSRADFTMHGIYMQLRMKFDQASPADAVRWYTDH